VEVEGLTEQVNVEEFSDAAATFLDDDGYPLSYPTVVKPAEGGFIVEKPPYISPKKKLTVTLNHITPLPTGGYTDRRYVMMRGEAEVRGGTIFFKPVKLYGWDEKKKPFFQYCEERVPQAKRYTSALSQLLGRLVKPRLPTLQLLFRATRFPFLIATAAPVLVGTGVAAYKGFFDPLLFALTLVGASLIHLALNMTNDYFDTKLGADEVNITPTPFSGGSRVIQYGLLTPRQTIGMAALFYGIGVVIGLYLAVLRGFIPIMALTALGVFISVAYTAPPFKLAYRGLGELAVGVGFGPVIVLGSHYVQAQAFSLEAVLASIPVGILIALILYINEIPDSPYDMAAGKRTLVTRLTKEQVLTLYRLLLAATYFMVVLPVVIGFAPPTALLALLTIPLAVKTVRSVRETFGSPYLMIPALAANIQVATRTALLHAAGFFAWAAINYFLNI
jgi:1,4-dihydroxy-2-naphthoate octaprenyltransferase